jgi:Leucine-rich repeat (LRR) protein
MNTLVGLLALSICVAPIPKVAKPPEPTKEQLAHAEKAIKALGGTCESWPRSDKIYNSRFHFLKPVTAEFLEKLDFLTFRCSLTLPEECEMTDDAFGEIVRRIPHIYSLDLASKKITSKGLAELEKLSTLKSLQLDCPKIDDDAMKVIGKLDKLEDLSINNCPITANGIKLLATNQQLRHVYFRKVKFTGDDLDVLRKLPLQSVHLEDLKHANGVVPALVEVKTLKYLTIHCEDFDDDGAEQLGKLKSLETLYLDFTTITDKGVESLAGLDELRGLGLFRTEITYDTAITLVKLKSLVSVHLGETKFSDAGLEKLVGSTTLKSINIRDTKVTDDGVAAFRKKKPDVEVKR